MRQTNKLLVIYNIGITLVCGFLVLTGFNRPNEDEITVKRINIVNEDGTPAIILANQERVPDPVLDGQSYKRAIKAGGIVLYDPQGNEHGGMAVMENENVAFNAMVLDYSTVDAIGMFSREDSTGYQAFLTVNDKGNGIGQGTNRLQLGTSNGTTALVINGTDGKPRVKLEVTDRNEVSFSVLDENGNTIKQLLK
ncbi:hypothetical protein SAMN05421747_13413 [Parapedobacter composti]|uniref:Uncharacterized protein n=1 Tax=Parapedobacter composti TaxID=623281 RepID=A0A1I1MMC7_9SPHI|nr:hypothetical protein [Parapedobacter composti]SFC83773.1 hypothetical protein SAMN05421747_13413 [Parapedobacter composti]